MVHISEEMIRKRAEHNNLEISTLEELSLHQQDVEKIENLDKWCRELKILYLQSNLIAKIENVSRLKKLEYLNLALNNIEKVENLEGCESLKKLDLTVNFVGELTSIECLKHLEYFEELYLTGNPCADYEGYRTYVLATLPNLKHLDGTEIEKSERIRALQDYEVTRAKIITQQENHFLKRANQRSEDNQYSAENYGSKSRDEILKSFTEEKVAYTPESRIKMHEQMNELKKNDQEEEEKPKKAERKFFSDDGRVLNINEPRIDFRFDEDEEKNAVVLELAVWKHLDTSLIDVDVQPTYVRAVIKGKILQLALPDEVKPDSSKAERSSITGALMITMPKLHGEPHRKNLPSTLANSSKNEAEKTASHTYLEFGENYNQRKIDYHNIVADNASKPALGNKPVVEIPAGFIDDPDVPPLI